MGDSSETFAGAGRLLSIGQLARLSGVHVKSLRYYGRLGILRPAHVDPATGYRHYTLAQLRLVEAIALCVELGLPLKRFAGYVGDGGRTLRYGRIVEDGLALAEARLRALRERVRFLETLRADTLHGTQCAATARPLRHALPARVCRVLPCDGANPDAVFHRLIASFADDGLTVGYESGALTLRQGGTERHFLYADLRPPFPRRGTPAARGLLRLPAAEWRCVASNVGLLEPGRTLPKAFPRDALILERDLFTADYAFDPPRYEWLCAPAALGEALIKE